MSKKITSILFSILNTVFFAVQLACLNLQLNPKGTLHPGILVLGLAVSAVAGIGCTKLAYLVYPKLAKRMRSGSVPCGKNEKTVFNSFIILWLILFAVQIPMFLVFYPGICAYDAYVQIGQCIDGAYVDHHPFLHTLVIKVFWEIGRKLGNLNLGVALFVLFQMIVISASFAACIVMLRKAGASRRILRVLLIFFALYPYNVFISLSVAKAALFTAAFVPFTILTALELYDREDRFRITGRSIVSALLVIPVVAFRTNARYAVLVFILGLFIAILFSKKQRKTLSRVLVSTLAGFAASMLILSIGSKAFKVVQGDRREMLSIPVQQLARTTYYHENELSDYELLHINSVILNEAWRDYDPSISDPVKRNVNTYHVLHSLKDVSKVYLRLLVRYPQEFINAFLAENSGYLYLADSSSLSIYGDKEGLGFVQTRWAPDMEGYGVTETPLFPGINSLIKRILSNNILQRIPIISIFFMPGIVTWIYLYALLWFITSRNRNMFLIILLPVAYLCTLLLGPTVQMRYIYPVWALLPLFMALYRIKRNED